MVVSIHRPTKAIIDLKAIKENVENEVARLPKATDLFAVVKANGYGHGAIETATAALEGGASGFCVATVDEGIELREAGFSEPILVDRFCGRYRFAELLQSFISSKYERVVARSGCFLAKKSCHQSAEGPFES